jgi:effector-binding domain-containing protein
MFDVIYSWLRAAPVTQTGNNYALYDIGSGPNLLVRVGFPVSAAFADTEDIRCFTLAPGNAAHAVHTGPYSGLHHTYAVLQAWCKQEKLQLASQSWELYGDWQKDESKLETGIYLRLQ